MVSRQSNREVQLSTRVYANEITHLQNQDKLNYEGSCHSMDLIDLNKSNMNHNADDTIQSQK